MAFITLWTRGARKCQVVFGGEQALLRLINETAVVREQVIALAMAAELAEIWEREEARAV
jgi:hypothetical protein